jgi:hypothetical protein
VGFTRNASACECLTSEPFAIQPASKAVVAIGRVTEIRPVDPDGWYAKAVVVEVTEGLRNANPGETITFYTSAQDAACAYRFTTGVLYVIESIHVDAPDLPLLPPGVPQGSQLVNRCGKTRELETPEGQQALAEIRQVIRRLPGR